MPPAPPPPPPGYGQPATAAPSGFSVGDAFNWGWLKFQQNAGTIVVAALIYLAVIVVVEGILLFLAIVPALSSSGPHCDTDPTSGLPTNCTLGSSPGFFLTLVLYAVATFVYILLFAFLQAGIIRGCLAIANGERIELSTFFQFVNVGNVVIGGLIVAAASFVGILLCGVGLLVVLAFTPFWAFFVVDKGQSGWDGVMSSVRLVNQHLGSVIVLIICVFLLNLLGGLCFIALLVTAPLGLLALTYGYRRLQNEPIAA